MSEPTGSFGQYGSGPWYINIHDGSDHQQNRYRTKAEREAAAAEIKRRHPFAQVVRGDDQSDARLA